VVPTWNYLTAHVYGRLVVHDDPAWTEDLVRRLTAKHEAGGMGGAQPPCGGSPGGQGEWGREPTVRGGFRGVAPPR
jgi:hypothetical protein